MPLLKDWELKLTPHDVLRAQGADPAVVYQRRPAMAAVAEWAVEQAQPLLQPQVLYKEFGVKGMVHERLNLVDGVSNRRRKFISGPLIAEHLRRASKVVVMLCTIGSQVEEMASGLLNDDLLRGLALDAAGSAAAEMLATQASVHFETQAAVQGLQCSLPLNPGMIGWSVPEGQPQLFGLLQDELQQCPGFSVTLNDSFLMMPRKTVSLALGLGEELSNSGRVCDFCNLRETCRYQDHYPASNP